MTRVRPATAAELSALAELAALTFPLACPPHVTADAVAAFVAANLSEAHFADYLADAQRRVLVAEREGVLVGYAMLVAGEPADRDVAAAVHRRPTIELSKCYVHPDAHGADAQGVSVAAQLMQAALEAAAERGAASVWLGVNQLNVRAQRFYAKQGFAQVGVKRFLVGDRFEDDFVFERALDSR